MDGSRASRAPGGEPADGSEPVRGDHAMRIRSSILPLALVVVTLVASVVIPARQTWRVMRLLRETAEVIEPARLLEARFELALTREATALDAYAESGGGALRDAYRAAVSEDDRQIAALDSIGRKLDTVAVARVATVRHRLDAWRSSVRASEPGVPAAQRDSARQAQEARYNAVLDAVDAISDYLGDESAVRRERIRDAERLSLTANTLLVLTALSALVAVAGLSRRERRLTVSLQRRVSEEATLREAAESLAAAFTVEDVLRHIAQSALKVTGARGAFIEQLQPSTAQAPRTVVVRASAGSGVPAVGRQAPCENSFTEFVQRHGEPVLVRDLARAERSCAARDSLPDACSALVVPLGDSDVPTGALFLLGQPGLALGPADLDRARTFAHLAALAYEKARLLEEAHRNHSELERVASSRSRLMRGFSHDIKNPLVAADGHAALLADGIYGELTARQNEGIAHIRRSILSAFALIDYLHELARTEASHIALTLTDVDLVDLGAALVDEYRASAESRGLAIAADVADHPVIVQTDRTRVRQILGNLLSNAVKYTSRGSITLAVCRSPVGDGDDVPAWACISVADTGRGIPEEKRQSIFEEFIRLDDDETTGAGLGLAISQRLTEALGGQIAVESEVGRGSTFTLMLPVPKPTRVEAAARPAEPTSRRP